MSHHCFWVEAQSWHFFVDLELRSAVRHDLSATSIVMSTDPSLVAEEHILLPDLPPTTCKGKCCCLFSQRVSEVI